MGDELKRKMWEQACDATRLCKDSCTSELPEILKKLDKHKTDIEEVDRIVKPKKAEGTGGYEAMAVGCRSCGELNDPSFENVMREFVPKAKEHLKEVRSVSQQVEDLKKQCLEHFLEQETGDIKGAVFERFSQFRSDMEAVVVAIGRSALSPAARRQNLRFLLKTRKRLRRAMQKIP